MGRLGRLGTRLTKAVSLVVEVHRVAHKGVVYLEVAAEELNLVDATMHCHRVGSCCSPQPEHVAKGLDVAESPKEAAGAVVLAVESIHVGEYSHYSNIGRPAVSAVRMVMGW